MVRKVLTADQMIFWLCVSGGYRVSLWLSQLCLPQNNLGQTVPCHIFVKSVFFCCELCSFVEEVQSFCFFFFSNIQTWDKDNLKTMTFMWKELQQSHLQNTSTDVCWNPQALDPTPNSHHLPAPTAAKCWERFSPLTTCFFCEGVNSGVQPSSPEVV